MPESKKDNISQTGFNISQYIMVVGIFCYIAFLFGKTGGEFKLFDENLLKSAKKISKSAFSKAKSPDLDADLKVSKNSDNLIINAKVKEVITSSGQKIPDIDILVDKVNVEELKTPYEGALFLIAEISNDISDIKSNRSKLIDKQNYALKVINDVQEQLKKTKDKNTKLLKDLSESSNNFDGSFISKFKYFLKDYVKIKKISTVSTEKENKAIERDLDRILKNLELKDYGKCLEVIIESNADKKLRAKAEIVLEELNLIESNIDGKDYGKILTKLEQISNEIKK